jgi:cytochrome c2
MRLAIVIPGLWCLSALAACTGPQEPSRPIANADPERGRLHIARLQCGACHEVPGVRAARGRVGPTLAHFSKRPHLAGKFPNEPDYLLRWLRDPPAMAPLTAMPALVHDEAVARDIAAYLYSLE